MGRPLESFASRRGPLRPRTGASVRPGAPAMSRAWLIGAGPGDAELITVKAMRALALADVVLVDDLVNPDILKMARADAQIVSVGKRGGSASTPQDEIVATMLAHLKAGRSVARLKGGDPFVFGRGGEELQALRAAGIRTDIISGITAGIAAPATLGIPVTHRGLAQGAIFVTGHSAGEKEPDWRALAATGMTLVIYMGMRRLDGIVDALLRADMAAGTPCVAIESATLPAQRQTMATLETLPAEVRRMGLGSPAILVIGSVAALACPQDVAVGGPSLAVGIGCRRGVSVDQIEAAVRAALTSHTMADVACVATLESKADEPALVAFCERHQLPLVTFSADEVQACFACHPSLGGSLDVQAHVGVPGVCKPCALLASRGGKLVQDKCTLDGVTVAIAASQTEDPTRDAQVQKQA
ncbi:uroporphyrinogen-III C-methyltransferase [Trinickia sp.]|uniref:uroporphyrinogen-III C-methyltransferase n=1 Tax=Trinickia sp. TaxID=2571163 RepID=UPI003F8086BB